MKPAPLYGRIALFAMLALSIMNFSAASLSAQGLTPTEQRKKEIEALEKQIADLNTRLKNLRERELVPVAPRQVWEGLLPDSFVNGLSWRSIGPATMGGRITSIAVAPGDPSTYWVASASGGLLKTTNNGFNFTHHFDHEATVSIGAIAVAPSNKDIVWVGTGEANPRNSVSYGDGVYKSVDGGKTWKNMGLRKSFQIGKIVIHPTNPEVVYVGVLGRLYGRSAERGVFKTTDGGKTWKNVLFVDEMTGVIDMAMHPTDPETLIVAAWERQRDEFDAFLGDAKAPQGADEYAPAKTHGAGSGLYRTMDGGKTFSRLTKGLPTVKMGRIGLDFSRKNPNVIFAVIDTEKAGTGPAPPQAYLGLNSELVPNEGVKVTLVTDNSPAALAGIQAGDFLVKIGKVLLKTESQFFDELRKLKPDDKITFEIRRGKAVKEVEITLGRRPTRGGGMAEIGMEYQATPDGIEVVQVTAKGPAEAAGLKAGDLITKINQAPLESRQDFLRALFGKRPGSKITLNYIRGKESRTTELMLAAPTPVVSATPYASRLGGNLPNVQNQQGPEGFQTGGIFKSTDNGDSWTRINSLNERPFYFSVVRVDPTNDQIIYSLGVDLYRSTDGGKTFTSRGINRGLHSDHHDLWINPKDGRHMILATDGGFYVTYDQAAHWDHMNHAAALSQFYHVTVDNRKPYRVYGGLQDNGSWGGPSQVLGGGDGFVCRVDPFDPDIVYGESQNGNMFRRNLRTGEFTNLIPRRVPGMPPYRFNWNTPFILSEHNPRLYYSAGNYVFRSVNRGEDQRPISPEITRTKRGSATALAESPRTPDVLWVGTDDGALWITRDHAKTWTNVSSNLLQAGVPGPRWIASIEASRWATGRAYVVLDAHRSDDDEPYVFVTEDFGQTWKSIRANLPWGSTRVLREDRQQPNLLYLGTEFGIWASINRGGSWTCLNGTSFPTVAVHEFAQPTDVPDLVVGTHGRGVWILNVNGLRQLAATVLDDKAPRLLTPASVTRWLTGVGRGYPFSESARRFQGQNPGSSAEIEYYLPKKANSLSLRIEDLDGKVLANVEAKNEAGFHRATWNMRISTLPASSGTPKGKGPPRGMGASTFGQQLFSKAARNGTYRVVLTVDGQSMSKLLVIEGDPTAPRDFPADNEEWPDERALRKLFERQRIEANDY